MHTLIPLLRVLYDVAGMMYGVKCINGRINGRHMFGVGGFLNFIQSFELNLNGLL